MRTVFVIALMSSQCGIDVLCWKAISASPEYRTIKQCRDAVSMLNELDLRKFKCIEAKR